MYDNLPRLGGSMIAEVEISIKGLLGIAVDFSKDKLKKTAGPEILPTKDSAN
jgi:hypothetical protein